MKNLFLIITLCSSLTFAAQNQKESKELENALKYIDQVGSKVQSIEVKNGNKKSPQQLRLEAKEKALRDKEERLNSQLFVKEQKIKSEKALALIEIQSARLQIQAVKDLINSHKEVIPNYTKDTIGDVRYCINTNTLQQHLNNMTKLKQKAVEAEQSVKNLQSIENNIDGDSRTISMLKTQAQKELNKYKNINLNIPLTSTMGSSNSQGSDFCFSKTKELYTGIGINVIENSMTLYFKGK